MKFLLILFVFAVNYNRGVVLGKIPPDDVDANYEEIDELYQPVNGGDPQNCNENMTELISDLIESVKNLQRDLTYQNAEIKHIQSLIENCAGCALTQVDMNTCRHSNPCYPNVECFDSENGMTCGRCPAGYAGDGRSCRRVETCDVDKPCFAGVVCTDTDEGASCGSCPRGYEGNGRVCTVRRNFCEDRPCNNGLQCLQADESPFYMCRSCPAGFASIDGISCTDIDECDSLRPCDPNVQCTNLSPGYRCESCPFGYRRQFSQEVHTSAIGEQTFQRQHCQDINECYEGSANCGLNMQCINTDGSYECQCLNGYVKSNSSSGCFSVPGMCQDGTICDRNAVCRLNSERKYFCKCKVGWAGDGIQCGSDRDLDGWPDRDLGCSSQFCRQDNCLYTPNSGQEDTDKDGIGDACDPDIDNDTVPNERDNCPNVYNYDQSDIDRDGIGDACDTLNVITSRPIRRKSFCRTEGCKFIDRDRDGIPDEEDNCIDIANSDQVDVDEDGAGDACDSDIDNDGIPNDADNCPLIYNPDQKDSDQNRIGDICENDSDGDGIDNQHDVCPYNRGIFSTDFRTFEQVALDPEGQSQIDPKWITYNNGAEMVQTMNSDPGLAIGYDSFGGVDFEGTLYVDTNNDDDYIGFIFSYQNSHRFYAVMWKRNEQEYWHKDPFVAYAEPGIQIKLIYSQTGPGEILRNSLWHTGDTEGQVKLLWKDPKNVGWKDRTAYRWHLIHRPKIGLINMKIFNGKKLVVDSGNIYDSTLQGGRLGMFVFSQEMTIWSNLFYKCNDNIPLKIYNKLPAHLQKESQIESHLKRTKANY